MSLTSKKMKKIAIVEPLKHYEVLASILRSLSNIEVEIYCFTTAFCRNQIEGNTYNVHWYTSDSDSFSDDMLYEHLSILKSCEAVFFTTIDLKSKFIIDKDVRVKMIALVHNCNNFFFQGQEQIEKISMYFFNKIRGDFKKAKQILDRLDRVVVPTEFIANHLEGKLNMVQDKLESIEVAFPAYAPQLFERPEIIITIPGVVNQDRRDYELIAGLIPKVDRQIERPVKLIFLGKIFSKKEARILDRLKAQPLKHFELITYQDYIPIGTFKAQLRLTDFLLLPIQEKITYKSLQEQRGKTCISGNINDLVQYALPAISPNFYPLHQEIQPLVDTFSTTDELSDHLVKWIENRTYHHKKTYFDSMMIQYKEKVISKNRSALFI